MILNQAKTQQYHLFRENHTSGAHFEPQMILFKQNSTKN